MTGRRDVDRADALRKWREQVSRAWKMGKYELPALLFPNGKPSIPEIELATALMCKRLDVMAGQVPA